MKKIAIPLLLIINIEVFLEEFTTLNTKASA